MKNRKMASILNIFSLAAALLVNFLATSLPLNNLTTREISDSFDIYFVPAGYAFSIWGVIYLGLLAFAVFQALPKQLVDEHLAKVDAWFMLSNLANALWLVCFHYRQFILALVFMGILLISLINIFKRLEIGKRKMTAAWKWAVEIPFSIYFGWITVATIANTTQVLDFVGWDGFGISEEIWFLVVTIMIAVISALMSFNRRAFEYVLVLDWALVGIAVKFPQVPLVAYSALGGALIITIIDMIALVISSKPKTT